MRRSQKSITLLGILFELANKKNKILAVTRATRDVILKKPRISGAENGDGMIAGTSCKNGQSVP